MEYTASVRKILDNYDIEASDLIYCQLSRAGWGKFEAIFHAYNLQWFDIPKINQFFRERSKSRPGISTLLADWTAEDKASAKELKDLKEKLKSKRKTSKQTESGDDSDQMSKEELGKMYIRIMRSDTDDKTKMDASKAYSALYQLQKEQDNSEDDRINFFLPVNCHYCDRCRNCELKTELEKRGCRIRAKRTSPYLWEIASAEDAKELKDTSE